MNSRTGLFSVLLIIVLLGAGYFFYNQNAKKTTAPAAVSTQQQPTGGNVFSSIKDALSKSLTLKCDYPDAKGRTVTSYIKGGKVREVGIAGSGSEGYGDVLMRDNKMYIWNAAKKQGMTMSFNVDQMKNEAAKVQPTTSANQGADYLATIEKYKDSCKATTVADSMFDVPADVKFVDMAEQMKNSVVDGGK